MSDSPPAKKQRTDIKTINNFIDGQYVASSSGKYMDVHSPSTGAVIAKVALSTAEDVARAVKAGQEAFKTWSAMTVKNRVKVLHKFQQLMIKHEDELAELIMLEHGKNRMEALGDVRKGNETVEYAASMPQLIGGRVLEVSGGVECKEFRLPHGVVASIVPFNFPSMVPMWTLPIAIAVGNCLILKPSEKVPITAWRMSQLLTEAGVPKGVVQIINGTVPAVNAICDHPEVKAVSFVGSTRVAKIVAHRVRALDPPKRVLALGGAKNHLVAMPDCNIEMTAQDVVNSYSGCSGQRCMAASVLLTVGKQEKLLEAIVKKSKALEAGSGARQLGPVIDAASRDRILRYIDEAEKGGAQILVDGRSWAKKHSKGFWVGPTVILHTNEADKALHDEIFGPVLSILAVSSKEEALRIENANPYGNAAAVYTSTGQNAQWFQLRFQAAMIGVNIGVPVPREPFSFGGQNASKFGDFDITGDGAIEFFTIRRKITTKWTPPPTQDWMS